MKALDPAQILWREDDFGGPLWTKIEGKGEGAADVPHAPEAPVLDGLEGLLSILAPQNAVCDGLKRRERCGIRLGVPPGAFIAGRIKGSKADLRNVIRHDLGHGHQAIEASGQILQQKVTADAEKASAQNLHRGLQLSSLHQRRVRDRLEDGPLLSYPVQDALHLRNRVGIADWNPANVQRLARIAQPAKDGRWNLRQAHLVDPEPRSHYLRRRF
mmetsp:Transcript_7820/g.29356  ORF Transcript_7820/g.29356 Transcript_7820/m.29356 type:complete len:215 (+) Transcript_7820:602-1246(+)